MGDFKKFLRFEHGIGVWIDRKGHQHKFGDGITHEEWAQTQRHKSTGDLMRDGWARVRIQPSQISFQTNNPKHVHDALDLAREYPGRSFYFDFKGHQISLPTQTPQEAEELVATLEQTNFPPEIS